MKKPIKLTTQDEAVDLYQRIWQRTVRDGETLDVMREVISAFGHELDPVLEDVLDLSLFELRKISRFGGNPNVGADYKGNTAQHVLQGTLVACYDLVDEFREFLLPAHLTGRRIWNEYDPELIDHMVSHLPHVLSSVLMQFLSHDDGEKLFEPASVTQNVNDNMRKDWPKLERRVAYLGVALALYAHDRFQTREEKRAFYGDTFAAIREPARAYFEDMKEKLKAGSVEEKDFAARVTDHIIGQYIEPVEKKYGLNMVAGRYQRFVDEYLSRYDEPEGFGRSSNFAALYTKIGQKNHSVMHINEHHGLGDGVPHETTTSLLTVASLGYAEAMLPRIFPAGPHIDPIHKRLALRTAWRVYETNLQMAKAMPPVIDLAKKRGEEHLAGTPGRLEEIRALVAQLCPGGRIDELQNYKASHMPGTLRTAFHLRARYEAAMAEVKANPGFEPPERPYYELETLSGAVAARADAVDQRLMTLYPGGDERDRKSFIGGRWRGPAKP